MCRLISDYDKKQFTGYKVAFKKENGKYYSIAMGFEYKVGTVKIPKRQNRIGTGFVDEILNLNGYTFEPNMVGRTAVFTELSRTYSERDYHQAHIVSEGSVVILRMTIKSELMKGEYSLKSVVAGKEIVSMKEVS